MVKVLHSATIEQSESMKVMVGSYQLSTLPRWGWEGDVINIVRNVDGLVLTYERIAFVDCGFDYYDSSEEALAAAIAHFVEQDVALSGIITG